MVRKQFVAAAYFTVRLQKLNKMKSIFTLFLFTISVLICSVAFAQQLQVGVHEIHTSKDENSLLVVSPNVTISIEKDGVSGVFKKETASGFLVKDHDQNGTFETFSYNIIGTKSGKHGTAYDWDRDGDTDDKVLFSGNQNIPPEFYTRLSGQWYLVKKEKNKSWVEIGGVKKEVRKVNKKYVVVK